MYLCFSVACKFTGKESTTIYFASVLRLCNSLSNKALNRLAYLNWLHHSHMDLLPLKTFPRPGQWILGSCILKQRWYINYIEVSLDVTGGCFWGKSYFFQWRVNNFSFLTHHRMVMLYSICANFMQINRKQYKAADGDRNRQWTVQRWLVSKVH